MLTCPLSSFGVATRHSRGESSTCSSADNGAASCRLSFFTAFLGLYLEEFQSLFCVIWLKCALEKNFALEAEQGCLAPCCCGC